MDKRLFFFNASTSIAAVLSAGSCVKSCVSSFYQKRLASGCQTGVCPSDGFDEVNRQELEPYSPSQKINQRDQRYLRRADYTYG